jgi:hypothetical protein
MNRTSLRFLLPMLLLLGGGVQEAKAISLDFQLSSSSATIGDTVTVDMIIGGLGNFTNPSLGAFDFVVNFNPALVGLTASPLTFGTLLGDEGPGESLNGSSFSTGAANLFVLSFLTSPELNALQPSTFTLATLSFNALASGINTFSFSSVVLGDGVGDPLIASLGTASVTITPSVVPELSSIYLLGGGLAMAWVFTLRRARSYMTR